MKRFTNYLGNIQKEENINKVQLFLICFCIFFFLAIAITLPNLFSKKSADNKTIANASSGTTYYVDNTITDTHPSSATPDCTTYNPSTFTCSGGTDSAYKTISDINAATFLPDNQILFRKGQTWNEQLNVPSSGTSGHPITFSSFGSGAKPIINGKSTLTGWDTAGNWTNVSGNIWSFSLADNPYRVWLSGAEAINALSSTVTSTDKWYYDSVGHLLYVYSVGNPATAQTNIERASTSSLQYMIFINQKDYITIDSLEIRGGRDAIMNYEADHNTIQNCTIGLYSTYGIGNESFGPTNSDSLTIRNNTIESGWNGTYDTWDKSGVRDGISVVKSMTNSNIYGNTISNWGHSGINLDNTSASNLITDNNIYQNDISSPNTSYMRGYGVQGDGVGKTTRNKFYRNYIHDTTVRNQINGNANEFSYNIIYATRNRAVSGAKAQGVTLEGYAPYICTDNLIYNNIFYDLDEPAIWVADLAEATIKTGNIIRNNIIIDAGKISRDGHTNIGIRIDSGATVGANIYQYNLIYKSGTTNIISYYGSTYSASGFNIPDSNGDTVSNNIQLDPLFVGGGEAKPYPYFYPRSYSPVINAGMDVGLTSDYLGTSVPQGAAPDIGAFEYVSQTPTITNTPTSIPANTPTIINTPTPTLSPTPTIALDTQPPTAPSNLRAKSTGKNSIAIVWNTSTDNVAVTGYEVWRSTSQTSNWVQIATIGGSTLTYNNTGLNRKTTYYYQVRALDAQNNKSPFSNILQARTQ